MSPMHRRTFLGSLALLPLAPRALVPAAQQAGGVSGFPQLPADQAYQIVADAHRSLDAVRAAVERAPELALAAYDWGYGDWETALGAASHTGQREIAALLLDRGAPPTLFSATMLGHLRVVEAMVEARPGAQGTLGPHGITLLAHARAGGDGARPVVEFLERVGGADNRPRSLPFDAAERFTGRYQADGGLLTVELRNGALGVQREGMTRRGLLHLGAGVFHPVGAPAVRVRFEEAGGAVTGLVIAMAGAEIRARRL